jgi:hypothetical protein
VFAKHFNADAQRRRDAEKEAYSIYFNAKGAKTQRSQRAAEQKEQKGLKNLSKIEHDSYFYCSLLLFAILAPLRPLR